MPRLYQYVGPTEIATRNSRPAAPIQTRTQLAETLTALGGQPKCELTVTFVIDQTCQLRIADRRSEHVACAGGEPVRSAGEMTFAWDDAGLYVEATTNQSTGYCPEPDSYAEVKAALTGLELRSPDDFTAAMTFRKCPQCGQTNLVKDGEFVCAVCGAGLPVGWNYE